MQRRQGDGRHHPAILLEVQPASSSGDLSVRAAVPEEFRARAGEVAKSIAEVAERFRSNLEPLLERKENSSWQLGSVEVEFNIAVQAEAGVLIAKTTAGATFSARIIMQSARDSSK